MRADGNPLGCVASVFHNERPISFKMIIETGVFNMKKVLFLGLGTMGSPISSNLLKAGLEVRTVPRPTTDPQKLEIFRHLGGQTFDSVPEAIQDVDIIFSMVTDDKALISALLRDDVINHLNPSSVLVDMTSCSAKAIQMVAEAYAKEGVKTIDAPVSGGVPAAIAGTMIMICAGDRDVFEAVSPVLNIIGSNIQYVGPEVGTGKKMKALNNLLGAIHKASTCEVFQIAQKAGLDLEMFGKIIAGSSGNSAQFALVYPACSGKIILPILPWL